jgi:hypothetical protein
MLVAVCLAPSPLWEPVTSFRVLLLRVLLHHGRDTMHAPWATCAPGPSWHGSLPLLAAMCLQKHCPDFLSPPDASLVGFEEEAAMAAEL